jgi:hypothetical protein
VGNLWNHLRVPRNLWNHLRVVGTTFVNHLRLSGPRVCTA